MRIIGEQDKNKWERKISIELSLRELQILFDSVGSSSWDDYKNNWEMYDTDIDIPYNIDDSDQIYSELEEIIYGLGGVTLG